MHPERTRHCSAGSSTLYGGSVGALNPLALVYGILSILQPTIVAPDPRFFRRFIVILVLVLAVIVAARAPMPTLPDLPPLQLLAG